MAKCKALMGSAVKGS